LLNRYDANGSRTNEVTTGVIAVAYAYVYNVQNQLSSLAVDGGAATTLLYDYLGIRVRAGNTKYLIDPLNPTGYAQVLEERTSLSGDPAVTYVYGLDLISQKRGSTVSCCGYDGLGSARYLGGAVGATGAACVGCLGQRQGSFCRDSISPYRIMSNYLRAPI
jgi:hypothetical protein